MLTSKDLVKNEVYVNVNSMVQLLMNNGLFEDNFDVVNTATSECAHCDVDIEYGDEEYGCLNCNQLYDDCECSENDCDLSDVCPECLEEFEIREDFNNPLEYWIVSGWLAEKLESNGAWVARDGNVNVWGRKTSGQAIKMDGVIAQIVNDLTS